MSALGLAADRGFDQAVDLLNWSENFFSGRFTSADQGFDPYLGSAYRFQIDLADGSDRADTWAELSNYTFGLDPLERTTSIADASHGTDYVASAAAALATLITYTQSTASVEAYGFLMADAYDSGAFSAANTHGYLSLPRWLLMPRMSDGSYLDHSNIHVGSSWTGNSQNEMLIGDNAANIIAGGAGADWLIGNGGNDKLSGEAGDDILIGGSGADEFAYSGSGFGADTISDFDVLEDSLMLSASMGDGTLTAAEVTAAMTAVAEGVLINFGSGDQILLEGLLEADIAKVDFTIGG